MPSTKEWRPYVDTAALGGSRYERTCPPTNLSCTSFLNLPVFSWGFIHNSQWIFRSLLSLLSEHLLLEYSWSWCALSRVSMRSSFHSCSTFLKKYLFHKPFGLMANKKSENEHHTACGTFVRRRQTGIILAILLEHKSPGYKTKKASNISRRTQEYYWLLTNK